jgi:hypothetical protein
MNLRADEVLKIADLGTSRAGNGTACSSLGACSSRRRSPWGLHGTVSDGFESRWGYI